MKECRLWRESYEESEGRTRYNVQATQKDLGPFHTGHRVASDWSASDREYVVHGKQQELSHGQKSA
jgi:hypothetical protein